MSGYRRLGLCAGLSLMLASTSAAWGAEDAAPADGTATAENRVVNELRQEVEMLRQRDNDQVRAINLLLERIKKIENTSTGPSPGQTRPRPVAPGPADTAPPPRPVPPAAQALPNELDWFHRRLSLETGISYSRFDRQQLALAGFLALDAIFLGRLSVDEVESDSLTWDLSLRYGITDRLHMDLNLPYLYRQTLYRSGGAKASAIAVQEETVESDLKLGDASLGLQYNLVRESTHWPGLSLSMRIKGPSGSHPYGVEIIDVPDSEGNLSVPQELPTGNGVWSATAGVSLLRTIDPAVLFLNLSTTYNRIQSFDDIDSKAETQTAGEVKLGDALQYVLGMGFALNERLSVTLAYSQQFKRKSKTRQEGFGWNQIVSSQANASSFNNSVTYALNRNWSMVSNLGIGLTEDAPDVTFGLKVAYSF